jgi:polypeptide N-acetylgalactosaminyltransferase
VEPIGLGEDFDEDRNLAAPRQFDEQPGEMGRPVTLPSNDSMPPEMARQVADGWDKNGFNLFVSDMISVRRSLPDVRPEE